MGMYDNVSGKFKCPECGHIQTEFQTKSYDCLLDTLDFRVCDYFYSSCDNCKAWLEVSLKPEKTKQIHEEIKRLRQVLTPEHYEVFSQAHKERYGKEQEESTKKT